MRCPIFHPFPPLSKAPASDPPHFQNNCRPCYSFPDFKSPCINYILACNRHAGGSLISPGEDEQGPESHDCNCWQELWHAKDLESVILTAMTAWVGVGAAFSQWVTADPPTGNSVYSCFPVVSSWKLRDPLKPVRLCHSQWHCVIWSKLQLLTWGDLNTQPPLAGSAHHWASTFLLKPQPTQVVPFPLPGLLGGSSLHCSNVNFL